MNKLIKGFLEEENGLNIANLLDEDETLEWEILVKAMDGIDILHIGRDLMKITKTYQLSRWQEMSILAYVKVLEMMMKQVKDVKLPTEEQATPESDVYNGSMFG